MSKDPIEKLFEAQAPQAPQGPTDELARIKNAFEHQRRKRRQLLRGSVAGLLLCLGLIGTYAYKEQQRARREAVTAFLLESFSVLDPEVSEDSWD